MSIEAQSNLSSSIPSSERKSLPTSYRNIFGDEIWTFLKPYAVCSSIAVWQQTFIIPTQNIKVALQLDHNRADITRFRSCIFLFKYFRTVGVLGFWRGTSCSIQRAFILSIFHLWLLHPSSPLYLVDILTNKFHNSTILPNNSTFVYFLYLILPTISCIYLLSLINITFQII